MELARLLAILRKNRQMLILLCLSATVNAVILTYFIAEKYEGKALVAIRPPQVLKLGKEMEVKQVLDFPVSTMIPFEAMGKTYRDIIESHAVAERIVRALQLDHETTETRWFKRLSKSVKKFFKDAWTYMKYERLERGSELETAIEELQDSLTVVATRARGQSACAAAVQTGSRHRRPGQGAFRQDQLPLGIRDVTRELTEGGRRGGGRDRSDAQAPELSGRVLED